MKADCALLGCGAPPKEDFRPLPPRPLPPPPPLLELMPSSRFEPASSSKSPPSPDAAMAPPPPLLLPRPRRPPLPAAAATRGRFLADAGTEEAEEEDAAPLVAVPAAVATAMRRFSAAVTYPLLAPDAPPFSSAALAGDLAADLGLFTALFPVDALLPYSSSLPTPPTPSVAALAAASPLPAAAAARLPVAEAAEADALFLVEGALLVLLRRPRGVATPPAPFSPAWAPPKLCRPRRPSERTACSVPSRSPWKL